MLFLLFVLVLLGSFLGSVLGVGVLGLGALGVGGLVIGALVIGGFGVLALVPFIQNGLNDY